MSNKLRPYQLEDIKKLAKFARSACLNQQRTGKTPTALGVLFKRKSYKNIIVCTKSAIPQWIREYKKWTKKPCIAFKNISSLADWKDDTGLVISYDTLKRNSLVKDILSQNPTGFILDEGHRIKNPKALRTKTIYKMVEIPNFVYLSGTPSTNKHEDVFSLLHMLEPTLFKSYWKFLDEYMLKEKKYSRSYIYTEIIGFKPLKQEQILNFLAERSTQRKRKEVMPWLPKEEPPELIYLELSKEQKKYLAELAKMFETEHIVAKGTLDRLIRYRQICLHPKLLELKGSSPKLDWIKSYIEDYTDKSIVLFSKFTSFIKLACDELNIPMLVGSTPTKQRDQLVLDFQNKKIKQLFINIDAGKEALTLDSADVIIFTDLYPPVSDIEQARDRFVATTEDKADKENTVFYLLMKDSFDEHIYELITKNAKEIDIINNYRYYMEGVSK